ncbi:YwqG family protein [Paenibacillus sp. sgz500958]|uniref:YwqG family protein n=1 Tax=Paenibacillus sp. sgz500958 TaxID=3242475 RepID=UPI0036D23D38
MKRIALFVLIIIFILSGCEKKNANNNEDISSMMDVKADVLSLFQEAGLEDYSETFQNMIKPSIRLISERAPEKKLKMGQTKLGGQPDLPANFKWPYWKEYPMSFIAQINLQEMPNIQTDSETDNDIYPTKGIIYFFYTAYPEAMYEDGDFDNNPETSKVLYYDGELNNLIRTQPPKQLSEELQFTSARVTPRLEWNVPDSDSYEVYEVLGLPWGDDNHDKYWEVFEENFSKKYIEGYTSEFNVGMNRLYGYHDPVQGEYKGEGWRLLLQIDSEDSTNMVWDDMGRLYFWIKDMDLKNLQFDGVTTIREGG